MVQLKIEFRMNDILGLLDDPGAAIKPIKEAQVIAAQFIRL